MKTRILVLTVLIVLILPELTPAAAQQSTWRVESPVSLSEALDSTKNPPAQVYIARRMAAT